MRYDKNTLWRSPPRWRRSAGRQLTELTKRRVFPRKTNPQRSRRPPIILSTFLTLSFRLKAAPGIRAVAVVTVYEEMQRCCGVIRNCRRASAARLGVHIRSRRAIHGQQQEVVFRHIHEQAV